MKKLVTAILLLIFIMPAGGGEAATQAFNIGSIKTYRDIPGVTASEVEAVEEFRKNGKAFVYGVPPSTEAFLDADGGVSGFAALFCETLTGLFGIPFQLKLLD